MVSFATGSTAAAAGESQRLLSWPSGGHSCLSQESQGKHMAALDTAYLHGGPVECSADQTDSPVLLHVVTSCSQLSCIQEAMSDVVKSAAKRKPRAPKVRFAKTMNTSHIRTEGFEHLIHLSLLMMVSSYPAAHGKAVFRKPFLMWSSQQPSRSL